MFDDDSQDQFDPDSDLLRCNESGVGFPSADNRIAIHRVPGNCANTIINMTVSGAARNAPASPQIALQTDKCEQHDDGGEIERVAGHARLNEIADQELPDADANEHGKRLGRRRKLHQRDQRREHDADDRPNSWDEIEKENQERPEQRVLQPQQQQASHR